MKTIRLKNHTIYDQELGKVVCLKNDSSQEFEVGKQYELYQYGTFKVVVSESGDYSYFLSGLKNKTLEFRQWI